MKERVKQVDFVLLGLVILMTLFGVIMIGSAGNWKPDWEHFSIGPIMTRQLMGLAVGLLVILVLTFMSRELLKFLAVPAYFFMLLMLLAVLVIGVGTGDDGTSQDVRRWIPIFGGLNLQPSEFAKFFMILTMARFCDFRREKISRISTIASYGVLMVIPLFLIYKEPDLSTTIVTFAICAAMLFLSGIDWKYIAGALLLLALAVYIVLSDAYRPEGPQILTDYMATRIWAFFDPASYSQDYAYQTLRSQFAISSGGLTGLGLFNNTGIVPVPLTDFIFGIIGQETGFMGVSIYYVIFIAITARILWIGSKAEDLFGKLICTGVATWLVIQSSIHIGVTTGVIPNTGIPLPFVSYGVSSLLSNLAGIGLVMHVSRGIRMQKTRYITNEQKVIGI